MMASFELAIPGLLEREGGGKLVVDTGGLTRWGISKRAYPDVDIANLTREGAIEIYRRDYWGPLRAGEMSAQAVAEVLFDAAVQQGVKPAVRRLQRILWVRPDGFIGPVTLGAIAVAPVRQLVADFALSCIAFYARLARRPPHGEYLRGRALRALRMVPHLAVAID